MNTTAIRSKLKSVLKERGIAQRDLANALGMEAASINRIVHGKVAPNGTTMLRIATFLDVPVEEIFELKSPAA